MRPVIRWLIGQAAHLLLRLVMTLGPALALQVLLRSAPVHPSLYVLLAVGCVVPALPGAWGRWLTRLTVLLGGCLTAILILIMPFSAYQVWFGLALRGEMRGAVSLCFVALGGWLSMMAAAGMRTGDRLPVSGRSGPGPGGGSSGQRLGDRLPVNGRSGPGPGGGSSGLRLGDRLPVNRRSGPGPGGGSSGLRSGDRLPDAGGAGPPSGERLRALCLWLLANSLVAFIILQWVWLLWLAGGLFVMLPLISMVGPTKPRVPVRAFRGLLNVLFMIVLAVGLAFMSTSRDKPSGVFLIDRYLSETLRNVVIEVLPQFPVLYGIPGYGYSFAEERLGGRPVLSEQPLFRVEGAWGAVYYLRTRVFDSFTGQGWTRQPSTAPVSAGDVATGQPATGDVAAGQPATGDVAAGQPATGDVGANPRANGDVGAEREAESREVAAKQAQVGVDELLIMPWRDTLPLMDQMLPGGSVERSPTVTLLIDYYHFLVHLLDSAQVLVRRQAGRQAEAGNAEAGRQAEVGNTGAGRQAEAGNAEARRQAEAGNAEAGQPTVALTDARPPEVRSPEAGQPGSLLAEGDKSTGLTLREPLLYGESLVVVRGTVGHPAPAPARGAAAPAAAAVTTFTAPAVAAAAAAAPAVAVAEAGAPAATAPAVAEAGAPAATAVSAAAATPAVLVAAVPAAADLPGQAFMDRYTQLPASIDPAIRNMADSLADLPAADVPHALVALLADGYLYNLELKNQRASVNFLTEFLLNEKEGYCVHFASATVVLARLLGIPARYVTGFLVAMPSYDDVPFDHPIAARTMNTVTGLNAHAWAELWLPGIGWFILETTPPMMIFAPDWSDDAGGLLAPGDFNARQVAAITGGRIELGGSAGPQWVGRRFRVMMGAVVIGLVLLAILATILLNRHRKTVGHRSGSQAERLLSAQVARFRQGSRRVVTMAARLGIRPPEQTGWLAWERSVRDLCDGNGACHITGTVHAGPAGTCPDLPPFGAVFFGALQPSPAELTGLDHLHHYLRHILRHTFWRTTWQRLKVRDRLRKVAPTNFEQ
jgi:transglutaminase-like putative cysteine protease